MLLALIALALAAPTSAPGDWTVGSGRVEHVQTTLDGSLVGYVVDDQAGVLSVDSWETSDLISPCTVNDIALQDGDTPRLWVGCSDGTVVAYDWDGSALTEATFGDAPIQGTAIEDGSVQGVFYSEDNGLFAVVDADDVPVIQVQKLSETDASTDGDLVSLVHDGYVDAVLSEQLMPHQVLILHSGSWLTSFYVGTSTFQNNLQQQIIDPTDIAPAFNGGMYVLDPNNGIVWEYNLSGRTYLAFLNELSEDSSGLLVSMDSSDEYMAICDESGQVEVYELSNGSLTNSDASPAYTFTTSYALIDLWAGTKGYAFGGSDDGELVVLTDNPWITDLSADEPTATDGQQVTVTFNSDKEGSYQVWLGGRWSETGDVLLSDQTAVDGENSFSVTVDDTWEEGDNTIYVSVTTSGGAVGHARTTVTVDTVPTTPTITSNNLEFGDEQLVLSFDGIDDADLDYYQVYVTITDFNPDDYQTGGPAFDGTDDLTTPITVSSEPGARVNVTISPLTNNQIYYVAVRAVDTGGLISDLSAVVSNYPRASFSAGALSGEAGGAQCGAAAVVAGWWLVGLGLLAAGVRRRGAMLALLWAAGLVVAPAAWAQEDNSKGDFTPVWGSVQVRYGPLFLKDRSLTQVYGSSGNQILMIEAGPQIYRVAEVSLGFGFFQELAYTVDDAGNASSNRTMITWYPLTVSVTGRVQILDEQPLVPYGSVGLDYIFWNEKVDNGSGGKDTLSGGKFGWHWAVGGSFLLDVLAPGRASLLETATGINDTYLTFEYRRQYVNPNNEGLSFDAEQFTVGIKVDF